jgi:hypothetical protein
MDKSSSSFYLPLDQNKRLNLTKDSKDSKDKESKEEIRFYEHETLGKMIEIKKQLRLTNKFTTILEQKSITSHHPFIEIKKVRSNHKIQLHQPDKAMEFYFRAPVSAVNKTLYNSYLILEASGLYIPIHIDFYDKLLHCAMEKDGRVIIEKCQEISKISLNFGSLAIGEMRKKTLIVTNHNPFNVTLISLNCSLPNCYSDVVKITLESVEEGNNQYLEHE